MGLKDLDFFGKISKDNVTKPTIIGSILSLSAISLMLYLLLRQLIDFYSPHSKTDSVVEQPNNANELININIDYLFTSIPCNLISLDMVDIMNNHKGDISDTVKKIRLIKNQPQTPIYTKTSSFEDLTKAIESNEGCELKGSIPIKQVPGEFHISFHNYRNLYHKLRSQKPNLARKITMEHLFKNFNFGKMDEYRLGRFGLNKDYIFRKSLMDKIPKDNEQYDYNYFIKIIPHILVDENRGRTEYTYSFSINNKKTQFSEGMSDMPVVSIQYDFSPIYMKITHLKRDYLHFLTHVSAIIGGVFVVFSVINGMFTNIFDS